MDTSSREDMCRDAHVTSNVELRNNVRLLLNVELRNYVISRQIVERRVTSDCYLNIVVSLDCSRTLFMREGGTMCVGMSTSRRT